MLHNLHVTTGDDYAALSEKLAGRLVECRVEMELSKASRFAIRFEEDLCKEEHEIVDGSDSSIQPDARIGIFASLADQPGILECLLVGRVTKLRTSHVIGGRGSWVEIHGEDRRIDMNKVGYQAVYVGKASAIVEQLVGKYGFTPRVKPTLIEHAKDKLQLTQAETDLAFIEKVSRENNMDFRMEYTVTSGPTGGISAVTETAAMYPSPDRDQGGAPKPPVLLADVKQTLRLYEPADGCANITKFDTRIDYDKPASSYGFSMGPTQEREVRKNLPPKPVPVQPDKAASLEGLIGERKAIEPPKQEPELQQLAAEGLVIERSWFVEADCSAATDRLGFVVMPHMTVTVENMGKMLSGVYQVMKATHVFTPTDHLVDFTLRANGFEEAL